MLSLFETGLRNPNLVLYDKFRPANIFKAKGKIIHSKKPCRDVVTGVVPNILTDPDLRNTYLIIDNCAMNRACTPMRFRITTATVNT